MSEAPPDLSQLPSAQWRCLRLVSEVADVAHAARKLHCSQAILKVMLWELQASLGDQHIHVAGDQVHVAQALKSSIEQQRPACRSLARDL